MGQSRYDVHTEGRFGKYLQVCGQTVLVLRKEREGREQKVQSFADVLCGWSRRWRSEIIRSGERGIAAVRLMKLCDRHCVCGIVSS